MVLKINSSDDVMGGIFMREGTGYVHDKLRPPPGVPNDISTPSCKSSFISEPVDISIPKVYIA